MEREVAIAERVRGDRAGEREAFLLVAQLRDKMKIDMQKDVFAVFKNAADQGDATSMRYLGWFYENGFGVARDVAQASEWYEKAANNGDVAAKARLKQLRDK
jgi:TPR repeat protein